MTPVSRRSALATAVAALVGLAAGLTHAEQAAAPDLQPFLKEVTTLVKKHYPDATVTFSDQTIHFEFNTRKFMIHTPLPSGEWQEAREHVGPKREGFRSLKKSGIMGDLKWTSGPYMGMAGAPQSFDEKYFTRLFMAPETLTHDAYLHVTLKYPTDVPEDFLKDFQSLVNDFEKHIPTKAK
jgi:hypothetical protein